MRRNWIWKMVPVFILACLCGCAHDEKKEEAAPIDPLVRQNLETRIQEAERALDMQNYYSASELFDKFEKQYPQNIFLNRSLIGHARALSGQGKYVESLNLLRQVMESSLDQPKWLSLASFYASFDYEALGDEAKTFASLTDAQNLADNLPAEIAKAELPARFAAYYNRSLDLNEARKYFHLAEQGIASLSQNNSEKTDEWKARTYYIMGILSTNQISLENLQAQMDTLDLVQVFSLRSVELNHPVWSAKALQNLQYNYRDIWNTIVQIPKNSTLDAFAAEQEQKEAQLRAINEVLQMTQHLRTFRVPGDEENPYVKALFAFLDQIEAQGQKIVANSPNLTPLTQESLRRQGLHQQGTVDSQPLFPAEQKPLKKKSAAAPSPAVPPVDPNLKGN